MPDRTKSSGIMNLRDPYDEENYYRPEFAQENVWDHFNQDFIDYIEAVDPGNKESLEYLFDKYRKNKHL